MKENKENEGTKRIEKRIKKDKYLKEFGDQTSFHGFRYVTERSQLTIRRYVYLFYSNVVQMSTFSGLKSKI